MGWYKETETQKNYKKQMKELGFPEEDNTHKYYRSHLNFPRFIIIAIVIVLLVSNPDYDDLLYYLAEMNDYSHEEIIEYKDMMRYNGIDLSYYATRDNYFLFSIYKVAGEKKKIIGAFNDFWILDY